MTDIAQQTLALIVTNNHRAVPILEKHQLDFCCKGKRTLADACHEKGLDATAIAAELISAAPQAPGRQMPFNDMSLEQLTHYITITHHYYVTQTMPVILQHLEKVAGKHGDRFPFMVEVLCLFRTLADEMTRHMHKEETVVFPYIAELEKVLAAGKGQGLLLHDIKTPVAVLENEHEQAGQLMADINRLTNHYTPPPGCCTTFRITLAELQEFEEDLHVHVHLENNILFPKARRPWTNAARNAVGS